MELTRKAREQSGLDQVEMSDEFDVSQGAISKAETDPEGSVDELRKKIVECYLGIRLEGPTPCFKVVEGEVENL